MHETIETTKSESDLLSLTNSLQQELIMDDLAGNHGSELDWIRNNGGKFRREFDGLWREIYNDPDHAEIMNLFRAGDIEPLKNYLLPLIKDRLKKAI